MGCSKTDTEKRRRASEGKADAETVSIRRDLRVARNTKGRAGKRGRARADLPSCWERKAEDDHGERRDSHGLSGRATDQMCVAERTPGRAETKAITARQRQALVRQPLRNPNRFWVNDLCLTRQR